MGPIAECEIDSYSGTAMSPVLNAFTVDVEDYYHVSGFENHIRRETWDHHESRVVTNTHRILDLLARHGTLATFFVLGWVAERHPQLVRDIHSAGHELGSHSYWHRLVYSLARDEFRDDLRRSKQVIEDAAGVEVSCYRAPSFSITEKSLWALEVLVEEGITIDSSVFPVKHDRYGLPGATATIHEIDTPNGSIIEFPLSFVGSSRYPMPVGGGGYFRLYPYWLTKKLLTHVNEYSQRPFSFYIHPWEVDPDQPRLRVGSRSSRFRHYVNLQPTVAKLSKLLDDFRFSTLTASIHGSFVRALDRATI